MTHSWALMPLYDDDALAQAIARLAADPISASEMGRRGRQHVVRYFDRREQSVAFADVLLAIASNGRERASK